MPDAPNVSDLSSVPHSDVVTDQNKTSITPIRVDPKSGRHYESQLSYEIVTYSSDSVTLTELKAIAADTSSISDQIDTYVNDSINILREYRLPYRDCPFYYAIIGDEVEWEYLSPENSSTTPSWAEGQSISPATILEKLNRLGSRVWLAAKILFHAYRLNAYLRERNIESAVNHAFELQKYKSDQQYVDLYDVAAIRGFSTQLGGKKGGDSSRKHRAFSDQSSEMQDHINLLHLKNERLSYSRLAELTASSFNCSPRTVRRHTKNPKRTRLK